MWFNLRGNGTAAGAAGSVTSGSSLRQRRLGAGLGTELLGAADVQEFADPRARRFTRLFTVPTAHPQISATSS